MTKEAKTKAQNPNEPLSKRMRLRSAGNVIKDLPKYDPEIKKPSLIMDRELDEIKIIK